MIDSEPGSANQESSDRRTVLRWLLGALTVGVGAALACALAVRVAVDAGLLERRLNMALDSATNGKYEVAIGGVQWGLLPWSVRIKRLTLAPDSQDGGDSGSPLARADVRVQIPSIRIRGLHWGTLVWGRVLSLDDVLVRKPQLHIERRDGRSTERNRDLTEGDSTGTKAALSGLRIQQLRVEDGTLSRRTPDPTSRDSLWGLSLQFDRLSLDVASGPSWSEPLFDRLSTGAFDGYRGLLAGDPYEFRLGPGYIVPGDSVLQVEHARFRPTGTDEAFHRQHRTRVNRYRVAVERVSVSGFDADRFVETGGLHAGRVRVDTLDLSVYRDNHLPEDPNDPPPPMPQEALQRLDRSLRVDTLRVRDSRIRYTKRPEGVSASGTISFEDFWASAYNLTNVPDRMTASTPAVVEARTRVNGAGLLSTTIRVPLRADGLNGSFEGRVEAMDPRPLNETFVPLGGVRIESGRVDSLWFRADIEHGAATGTVGGVYRDLEIETLDKATGDRGIGHRLKTIASGLALRSENLPADGDLDTGQIQHTRDRDDSYFKFLWHALRSGIYSLVGIDRLPR